jgi:hypothetical protein
VGDEQDRPVRYLDEQPLTVEVQRLSLKPGDLVVVSVLDMISFEMAERLRALVAKRVPGHDVLVLAGGVRIGVLEQPNTGSTH